MVSPFVKLHVKVTGSGGEQEIAPSVTVPPPAAVKVMILSFRHALKGGSWLDTSVEPTKADWNVQLPCVRSCVLVFAGVSSFLLQEKTRNKPAARNAKNGKTCFFIYNGLFTQNK
jgi:hypothetical protein